MSHMTQLPGVPDIDDVKPGMAFYASTGPVGTTCATCAHRGYYRQGESKFNPRTGLIEERRVLRGGCKMFLKLTHRHGQTVEKDWRSCKYYEASGRE